MTDRTALPTRVLQFGDGYRNAAESGLSRPAIEWNVDLVFNNATEDSSFQSWLLDNQQHTVFQWQSPIDTVAVDYRLVGSVSGARRNGGGLKPIFFTRAVTFKRYYG